MKINVRDFIKRKKPTKAERAVEISSLETFSKVIMEQGERQREKDAAMSKKIQADLPKWKADLKNNTDDELITLYDNALQGGYSNTKLMQVLSEWKGTIRAEMLKRMAAKKGK